MKKFFTCLLFILMLIPMSYFVIPGIQEYNIFATSVEEELTDEINQQIGDLDFSNIEEIISSIEENGASVFGNKSFAEKVTLILSGEFSGGFSSLFKAIISLFFDDVLSILPMIASIIAIAILGGMINSLKPQTGDKSIGNVIHFVIYGVILILISSIVIKMIGITSTTLTSLTQQMEAVFPIILTLMTAVGGTVSVSIFQPAVAILSSSIMSIFNNLLMPMFLVSLALSFVSNLSTTIKLDKMVQFINSSFKWIIGFIFTIFTGFITIQGLSAGAVDGLSIKTAKYTIKSYIPLVGSYISDGLFLILASSNLIKNAVGGAGLLLLLATILSPLIQLIIFILALKLMAGIIEPMGDSRVAGFVSSLSKTMTMLVVMIICVSFMYFLLAGLMMCSANIV